MTENGKKIQTAQRERILEKLKNTRKDELVYLSEWQARIIAKWIEELKEG